MHKKIIQTDISDSNWLKEITDRNVSEAIEYLKTQNQDAVLDLSLYDCWADSCLILERYETDEELAARVSSQAQRLSEQMALQEFHKLLREKGSAEVSAILKGMK